MEMEMEREGRETGINCLTKSLLKCTTNTTQCSELYSLSTPFRVGYKLVIRCCCCCCHITQL